MREEELQGASIDDSLKEQRNEAVAGGVDEVRCACAYLCVGEGNNSHRWREREGRRKKRGERREGGRVRLDVG